MEMANVITGQGRKFITYHGYSPMPVNEKLFQQGNPCMLEQSKLTEKTFPPTQRQSSHSTLQSVMWKSDKTTMCTAY